jgi:hypothetical protein
MLQGLLLIARAPGASAHLRQLVRAHGADLRLGLQQTHRQACGKRASAAMVATTAAAGA